MCYRISNILNNNGQPLDNIPENEFYVNVDILNLNEERDAVVVLATYDQNGKMLNIYWATADSTAESRSSNIRVENPGGSVEAIKAMLILSLETPIPLCSSMSVSNSSATS